MADEFGLKLILHRGPVAYRMRHESLVERQVEVQLPTEHGDFRLIAYRQTTTGEEHLALIRGSWDKDDRSPVRCIPAA